MKLECPPLESESKQQSDVKLKLAEADPFSTDHTHVLAKEGKVELSPLSENRSFPKTWHMDANVKTEPLNPETIPPVMEHSDPRTVLVYEQQASLIHSADFKESEFCKNELDFDQHVNEEPAKLITEPLEPSETTAFTVELQLNMGLHKKHQASVTHSDESKGSEHSRNAHEQCSPGNGRLFPETQDVDASIRMEPLGSETLPPVCGGKKRITHCACVDQSQNRVHPVKILPKTSAKVHSNEQNGMQSSLQTTNLSVKTHAVLFLWNFPQVHPAKQPSPNLQNGTDNEVHSEERPYRCAHCSQTFLFSWKLGMHIAEQHPGYYLGRVRKTPAEEKKKQYRCPRCSLSFPSFHSYRCHYTMAHPIKCPECPSTFCRMSEVKRHIRTHTEEKQYTCSQCGSSFKTEMRLMYHSKTHTVRKPYQCEICSLSFQYKKALKCHLTESHDKELYQCRKCSQTFKYKRMLKTHTQTHYPPRLCYQCGLWFKTAPGFHTHMKTHVAERPYMCEVCSCSFKKMEALRIHMRTHTGENPFKCSQCPRVFKSSAALKEHGRMHSEERPFTCEVCASSFKWGSNLRNHMMIHTGERPYVCSLCPASFISGRELKKHSKKHTDEVGQGAIPLAKHTETCSSEML